MAQGRGRLRLTYFDNKFRDLIEFVSRNVLPQLGVPPAAAAAAGFGAYVNSQSNDAHGVEVSGEAKLGRLKALAAYTFLDAIVTESFSSSTLSPAENPAFPGIKIGQFGPLVGEPAVPASGELREPRRSPMSIARHRSRWRVTSPAHRTTARS